MGRNRPLGLTAQSIAAVLLLTACKVPFAQCKPSTIDSLSDMLEPSAVLIKLGCIEWVEDPPPLEFLLVADGTVYYQEGVTMVAQLGTEETLALVQRVLELGFECLEDGEPCVRESAFSVSCRTDQSFWYLEVRLPNGELKGIHDYYEIVDSPAEFTRIQWELMMYRHPEARPCTSADTRCACASPDIRCQR